MADKREPDDLRAAALGEDDIATELVEHKDFKYEVRAPSLAQQRNIRKRAVLKGDKEPDDARLNVQAIIACTFYPGTDKQVFEQADVEVLESKTQSPNNIVGKISTALRRVMKASMEDAEADFAETPSANSSSRLQSVSGG